MVCILASFLYPLYLLAFRFSSFFYYYAKRTEDIPLDWVFVVRICILVFWSFVTVPIYVVIMLTFVGFISFSMCDMNNWVLHKKLTVIFETCSNNIRQLSLYMDAMCSKTSWEDRRKLSKSVSRLEIFLVWTRNATFRTSCFSELKCRFLTF